MTGIRGIKSGTKQRSMHLMKQTPPKEERLRSGSRKQKLWQLSYSTIKHPLRWVPTPQKMPFPLNPASCPIYLLG